MRRPRPRAWAILRRKTARLAALGAVLVAVAIALTPSAISLLGPALHVAASGAGQDLLVPRVNATYSPMFTESCNPARASVHFFANASGTVPPYNFTWNFEDGTPDVFLQNPVHSFPSPGLYDPVLTVTDANGYSNGTILSLSVPPPPCSNLGTGGGTQPWVLDAVVVGFLVATGGLVAVASRRWRD